MTSLYLALCLSLLLPTLLLAAPEPLNKLAGQATVYEVQVRSANACDPDVGSPEQKHRCKEKISPPVTFQAETWARDGGCQGETGTQQIADLEKIKLGTLEDMLTDTDDYKIAISLRYIKEKVKANTVWLMPIFPHNYKWNIPHRCDNIGSPYSVRDYMHVRPSLSQFCIKANHTEFEDSEEAPLCFGNASFISFMKQAKDRGLRVMLDLAFNHFGHNYRFYDYGRYLSIDQLVGNDLDKLWKFDETYDDNLVNPEVVDSEDGLRELVRSNENSFRHLDALKKRCPKLQGDELVRAFAMYRVMQAWEKDKIDCNKAVFLEQWVPGFYTGDRKGGQRIAPSTQLGDNYSNEWSDVKFLYLHENHFGDERGDFYPTYVRNREYLFRVMNYWVAQGVQGFRLDHTSDGDSGIGPNFWRYVIRKVNFYDWQRKGKPAQHEKPIYLAEEFGDQQSMKEVVDAMIDGYIGDMRGGIRKESDHVREVLGRESRFNGQSYVLRALETHDEHRLYDHGTNFDEWTGAGFWAAGAGSSGMPMLLMGQELGARYQLAFRKSDFLRSRFEGSGDYFGDANSLLNYYGNLNGARNHFDNRALTSDKVFYLIRRDRYTSNETYDAGIHAQVKWTEDHNVVFSFINLWENREVSQTYEIPENIAAQFALRDDLQYCLIDTFTGHLVGDKRSGRELRTNLYVKLGDHKSSRLQWLRLERCD